MVAMPTAILSSPTGGVAARWSCVAFVGAGRYTRQPPLFDLAEAWARSPTFSRRAAYFHLSWDLGYKSELSVFGRILLGHGRIHLS